jgi:hypothetical protein
MPSVPENERRGEISGRSIVIGCNLFLTVVACLIFRKKRNARPSGMVKLGLMTAHS